MSTSAMALGKGSWGSHLLTHPLFPMVADLLVTCTRYCDTDGGGGPVRGHGTHGFVKTQDPACVLTVSWFTCTMELAECASVFLGQRCLASDTSLLGITGSLSRLTMLGQTSCPWMDLLSPCTFIISDTDLPSAPSCPGEGMRKQQTHGYRNGKSGGRARSDGAAYRTTASTSARLLGSAQGGKELAGPFRRSV